MKSSDLSAQRRDAVRAAFAYWLPRWDWEMPTRTGLSREQFQRAAESWPNELPEASPISMLAALGAVRELWDAERGAAQMLGVNGDELRLLIELLAKGVDDAV